MIHKNINLKITVKENRTETTGYRSIVFSRPRDFVYESGDWIDIQFDNPDLRGGKTYSLSSSPTEPDLMITFKDGISEIKKSLATISPGDTVTVVQYGNDYKFTLKPHKPGVLIAGGVGIAPFRSMLKEMVDKSDSNEVSLIYINKTSELLFERELNAWLQVLPNAQLITIITNDLKKKDRTKAVLAAITNPQRSFYIAGAEAMVEDTEHLLLDNGVDIGDIKIDSFGGY